MIEIKKSNNADTRTADAEVTKDMLLEDTQSHIQDVQNGCSFIANLILKAGENHDHTKIEYLDEFYNDFITRKEDGESKNLDWWQKHLTERHHLNDRVPNDVNLIDVIEMVVDCCMAGMARSGYVYDIDIPSNVLDKAVKNTQKLITSQIKVINDKKYW